MKHSWHLVLALAVALRLSGPEPVGGQDVRSFQAAGVRVTEVTLPGGVLDLLATGEDEMLILVAVAGGVDDPAGASHRLLRWRGDELETVIDGLSTETHVLALHQGSVLVGETGRIATLDGSTLRPLVEVPGLDLAELERQGCLDGPRLVVPELGRLGLYEGGRRVAEHELPLRADREVTGLVLTTPKVTALEVDGAALFAAGPEVEGQRRLRTLLIDPAADEPVATWSRLPESEELDASWLVVVDGQPLLVVTSVRADKMGIFDKQRLRAFRLTADRTRSGAPPSLAVMTGSHRWQPVEISVVDRDGDSHDDLTVIGHSGFREKLEVQVIRGLGAGRFARPAFALTLKARSARWTWKGDVTGDGVADLVAIAEGRVLLFAGSTDERRFLDKKPHLEIEAESFTSGAPIVGSPLVVAGRIVVRGGDRLWRLAL